MNPAKCLVAIPVFGKPELTRELLPDLRDEAEVADVLIIDNKGDYTPSGSERVIRPHENLGWAGGSNLGFRIGFSEGYSHVLTLNNDTRLSPGFVAGILDSRLPDDAGIIAPLYDDPTAGHVQQCAEYRGPAAEYQPSNHYLATRAVDGTALALTRDAWQATGGLDVRSFGFFAWGSEIDLAYRVWQSGFRVYITEMSYINHLKGQTARDQGRKRSEYSKQALKDFHTGMRQIYGRDWMTTVGAVPRIGFPTTRHALTDSVIPA